MNATALIREAHLEEALENAERLAAAVATALAYADSLHDLIALQKVQARTNAAIAGFKRELGI